MPDILPPQLVGVQQRPLYVKVRTTATVVASIWMVLAITGFGFFSGGTTSLALSLVLLYGTGVALIVVICAVYRLVNRSAVKRAEVAPEDTKAIVFVDTARSATEELLAALRPAAATGRPQYAPASPRTVRPAVSSETAAAVAASAPAAKQSAAGQAKTTAKASPKSALSKAVPNKSGKSAAVKSAKAAKAAKAAPGKSAPAKSVKGAPAKAVAAKSAPAKGAKSPAKIPPAKASQAKGRPGNNNGTKSAPAKRTGSSAERSPGKKQSSAAKDSGPGSGGPAVSAQHAVRSVSAKNARPVLVLASSNSVPQPSRQHIPESSKRAS
ncbi:hypothetical protein J2M53_12640 [Arthrobacter sp. zg-ZUI100]|uniref:hypothetical protein n=1 Tax=Arthrobacter jiangjiafuii TaxID=2817475 RepID=UPI001AEF103A|nr:hypothetical protein [Arthrobacter jiangjiafuii]MBP3037090.1 hypothetical protein [Arthrobacter jiangjiafuii]